MAGSEEPVTSRPLEGLHVLVVEDNDDAREMLAVLLEAHGATVTAASSSAEAVEALDRVDPDVLVSDISMPGEDGYELIARVRKRPPERGGRLPAIAQTALASPEARALASGFEAHLCRPVVPNDLVTTIAALTASC